MTKNGEPRVENRLVKQVKDTFQKLRSKVLALLNMLLQLARSVLANKPGISS